MAVPMNDFEAARLKRIAENNARLAELGVAATRAKLESLMQPAKRVSNFAKRAPQTKVWQPRLAMEPRRSTRIRGERVDYAEIDENDRPVRISSCDPGEDAHGLFDLMGWERGRGSYAARDNTELQEQLQKIRCGSQGRGSLYDSAVGITCHFCRQKKLCGEEGCPRCSTRDASKECIGKTECSKCGTACGKFCRACLLIRYGQVLEDVREQMTAGTWLCPHCFEDEHPEDGIICNSSICMKRRGLRPTGIAIYEAHDRGFQSVAHLLQDTLKKNGGIKALKDGPQKTEDAEAEEPKEAGCSGHEHGDGCSGHEQGEACHHTEQRRSSRRAARVAACDTAAAEHGASVKPAEDRCSTGCSGGDQAAGENASAAAAPLVKRGRGRPRKDGAAAVKPPLAPTGGVAKRNAGTPKKLAA